MTVANSVVVNTYVSHMPAPLVANATQCPHWNVPNCTLFVSKDGSEFHFHFDMSHGASLRVVAKVNGATLTLKDAVVSNAAAHPKHFKTKHKAPYDSGLSLGRGLSLRIMRYIVGVVSKTKAITDINVTGRFAGVHSGDYNFATIKKVASK